MFKITAEEAVRLSGHCGYLEACLAYDIARAYLRDHPPMACCVFGVCFYAGMVEGVRRERARRRRRQNGQEA